MKRFEPLRTYASPSRAGLRADRAAVGAGRGLGERVRREVLAAREAREEAALLLVGARELDPERAELLDGEDQAARRAGLRGLLDRDERRERAGADAAVLLGEHQPEEAVLAEELDHVPRELGGVVDLGGAWRDPLAGERADEVADLALLRGQPVARHAAKSRPGSARRRTRPRARAQRLRPTRNAATARWSEQQARSPRSRRWPIGGDREIAHSTKPRSGKKQRSSAAS